MASPWQLSFKRKPNARKIIQSLHTSEGVGLLEINSRKFDSIFWWYLFVCTHIISYLMLHDHGMVYECQCWQCLVILTKLSYCWYAPAKAHVKWIESWTFATEAHWKSKSHAAQGFTLFIPSTANIQKSLLSLHPPRRPGQPSGRDEMMRGSTL